MGLRIGRAAVAGRDMAGGIIRSIVNSVPAAALRAGLARSITASAAAEIKWSAVSLSIDRDTAALLSID